MPPSSLYSPRKPGRSRMGSQGGSPVRWTYPNAAAAPAANASSVHQNALHRPKPRRPIAAFLAPQPLDSAHGLPSSGHTQSRRHTYWRVSTHSSCGHWRAGGRAGGRRACRAGLPSAQSATRAPAGTRPERTHPRCPSCAGIQGRTGNPDMLLQNCARVRKGHGAGGWVGVTRAPSTPAALRAPALLALAVADALLPAHTLVIGARHAALRPAQAARVLADRQGESNRIASQGVVHRELPHARRPLAGAQSQRAGHILLVQHELAVKVLGRGEALAVARLGSSSAGGGGGGSVGETSVRSAGRWMAATHTWRAGARGHKRSQAPSRVQGGWRGGRPGGATACQSTTR